MNVIFNAGFWISDEQIAEWQQAYDAEHGIGKQAGKPVLVDKSFLWGGFLWTIPMLYVCEEGLVIDICRKIPKEEEEAFLAKWQDRLEESEPEGEELEKLHADNPMVFPMQVEVFLQGKPMEQAGGCSFCWYPGFEKEHCAKNLSIEERYLTLYQCEKTCGWEISRIHLCWPEGIVQPEAELTLTFVAEKRHYPCAQHLVTAPAELPLEARVIHPITQEIYRLHIEGMEQDTMPELPEEVRAQMSLLHQKYPHCFYAMKYCITPALAPDDFLIQDCRESDMSCSEGPEDTESAATHKEGKTFIGGGSGPTSIFLAGSLRRDHVYRVAASSLTQKPADKVEWRMSFALQRPEPFTLKLKYAQSDS